VNDSIKSITITKPSILRLPCETSIKCSDVHIPSSTCTKNTVAIKSEPTRTYKKVSNFLFSIDKLANRLETEYKSMALDSFKQLEMEIYNNNPSIVKIFKNFGNLFSYLLLLILFIILIAILKFIKINIQKQMKKIEKDINKFSDVFSLDIDTV
jgi:hypothetical protein